MTDEQQRDVPESPRHPRRSWAAFRASPFLPAVVISLIVAAAAGRPVRRLLHVRLADPAPRHAPTAVVGKADPGGRRTAFVRALEKRLDSSLALRRYPSYAAAKDAVEAQEGSSPSSVCRVRGASNWTWRAPPAPPSPSCCLMVLLGNPSSGGAVSWPRDLQELTGAGLLAAVGRTGGRSYVPGDAYPPDALAASRSMLPLVDPYRD